MVNYPSVTGFPITGFPVDQGFAHTRNLKKEVGNRNNDQAHSFEVPYSELA